MMESPSEVNAIFLEPLNCAARTLIIFVINNNDSTDAGGTHWSICAYSKTDDIFYHFDSLSGSNASPCIKLFKTIKSCLGCGNAKIKNVSCSQQANSFDCGIFALCHTDLVCQTFLKSGNLSNVKKLQKTKIDEKRNEICQIIKKLTS